MQNVTASAMPLPMGMQPGAQMMNPNAAAMQPMMVTPQMAGDPAAMAQMQAAAMNPATLAQMQAAQQAQMQQQMALANPAMAGQPQPMPMSAAHAALGAEALKPPSTIGAVVKSALVFGGLGAALGAGAGVVIGPLGVGTGALFGGLGGVLLGAIRGFRSAKRAQDEFKMMMQAAPADPNAAVPVEVANTGKKKVVRKKVTTKKTRTVTVKSGDTLGEIAKRHSVTVKQLHDLNRAAIGSNPSRIKVGITLKIPVKS